MAILPQALTGAILTAGQAIFPGSQTLPKIALALGQAIPTWLPLPTNVLCNGVTTGTVGAGTVTGKLQVAGGGAVIGTALNASGLVGPTAQPLGSAIETGCLATFNAGLQYIGVSPGVGVGTDVSKITFTNPATLIPILLASLQGSGVAGTQSPQIATGIANGVAALLLTGTGIGVVAGGPGPSPAAGTSISTVF